MARGWEEEGGSLVWHSRPWERVPVRAAVAGALGEPPCSAAGPWKEAARARAGSGAAARSVAWVFKPVSLCILQAPFVKNPSQAKSLLRLSCRSLHFGLCFSPLSRSSNLPCLWKCLRRLRLRLTRRRRRRRPHHLLEKTARSRKWRWKMRGARSRLPRGRRKMLCSSLSCARLSAGAR